MIAGVRTGTMRSMFMSVLGLAVMRRPSLYARAQITSTVITEVPMESTTSVPSSTITIAPTSSFGSMTVQCWRSTTFENGETARLEIPTSVASLFSEVVCWEIFSLNGGVVSIPVTPGPDFEPTLLQSSYLAGATADNAAASSSSSTDESNLDVILPATLVSSIVGLIILIFTTIYLLRWRARRKLQRDSRARRWVERNSAILSPNEAWAMKQTAFATTTKPEGV